MKAKLLRVGLFLLIHLTIFLLLRKFWPSNLITIDAIASLFFAFGIIMWIPIKIKSTRKSKKKTYTRSELIDACYKFKAFNEDIRKNGRIMSSSEFFETNYPNS